MEIVDHEAVVDRFLDVLQEDVLPITKVTVPQGNKVFGAAIILKSDLSLVIAATNRETQNPLFHGEISVLNDYWAMSKETRPSPKECYFLATHEPCPLCLAAITWSGFDNFYYFFTYEDSRDEFEIPHDLKILEEVFGCKNGDYVSNNAFWSAHSMMSIVDSGDPSKREVRHAKAARIKEEYAQLSTTYQSTKGNADIPLD